MAELKVGDQVVMLDEDGFLDNTNDWNEEVAHMLAKTEEVDELTEDHWVIINYLRNYFAEFGVAPMLRKMLKETKKTSGQLYELFPSGPDKGACKIAGLPKPTGCV
jgi:tRNA 2-thiouridine synthesizing protein E